MSIREATLEIELKHTINMMEILSEILVREGYSGTVEQVKRSIEKANELLNKKEERE